MIDAIVSQRLCFGENEFPLFIEPYSPRVPTLVRRGCGVRHNVPIYPDNCITRLHVQLFRCKFEAGDNHCMDGLMITGESGTGARQQRCDQRGDDYRHVDRSS